MSPLQYESYYMTLKRGVPSKCRLTETGFGLHYNFVTLFSVKFKSRRNNSLNACDFFKDKLVKPSLSDASSIPTRSVKSFKRATKEFGNICDVLLSKNRYHMLYLIGACICYT